jgi:hypothetical protein
VDTVASAVCRVAISFFVLSDFMSSDRGYLGDPVVNPHEVGVFGELGDDFARADPLGLPCYRCDRHEALLGSGMHSVSDLIQSLVEVPDGEGLSETFVVLVLLPVAVVPGVLVISGLIRGCVGGRLIF